MGAVEKLWVQNYLINLKEGHFNKNNVRAIKTLVDSNSMFNIPIILVAAGPSLEKNIHTLKENQNKFLILCADVVLYRLIEEGITPDFVCSIDPNPAIIKFWKDIDTSHIKLIAPTTTSPEVISLWQGDIFLFNQTDTSSEEKHTLLKDLVKPTQYYGFINNMFFVGATLLQVSTIFKPFCIYLMGYDLGFTDNKAYCKGFLDKKLVDIDNVGMDVLKERELSSDLEESGIKTTKLFILYRNTFLDLCKQLTSKTSTSVINCTEGGILTELPCSSLKEVAALYSKDLNKRYLGGPKKRKRKK